MCRPYLTFYLLLDIYPNNIVAISLIHSQFPLSLWKDDNLSISLNEDRKACPLTTDSSFGHHQYKPGLICSWRWLLRLTLKIYYENFLNLSSYECLTQFYLTNQHVNWINRNLRFICSPFKVCIKISKSLQAWTTGLEEICMCMCFQHIKPGL